MTMRYGTDEAEEGRRRLRRSPIQKDPRPVRVGPGGNVTPTQQSAPKPTTQPRAVGRQTVNEMPRQSLQQVGQIGGRVPSTRPQLSQAVDRFIDKYGAMQRDARMQRPQATPMPFAQQLVQSGMMNTQPIWDTSSGQGFRAPGYSVNPFHPMWGNPIPPQFPNPGMNPMNYYWDNPEMPRTPRVWTGNEMTPQGFREIMNTYGANVPWMRRNQMNPFGF